MITKKELVTFRITPDRTVSNRRTHDLVRAIHDIHESIGKRISLKGKQLREKNRFVWDIIISSDDVSFFCTVPKEKATFIKQQIELTWDKAAIQEEQISVSWEDGSWEDHVDICEMGLSRHNIFALKVDRRMETEPLGSLLIGKKELKDDDFARIQVIIEPINRVTWQDTASKHHETFNKGKTPRRMRISKKDAVMGTMDAALYLLDQAAGAVDVAMDVFAGKADERDKALREKYKSGPDMEKRMILIDGNLKTSTQKKKTAPTFKTWIRILAASKDPGRRSSLINTLTNSFHDLNGDNELQRIDLSKGRQKAILQEVLSFRPSIRTEHDPDVSVLSDLELGRLIELPTAALQDEHGFSTIKRRETQIPDQLKQGIPWGVVSHKKMQEIVHLPTNDFSLLCRPTVIIGKMGTGKTHHASRIGHLFPEHGFTSIVMDIADGKLIRDAVNALPADFPEDHIIILDFGNLAWMPGSDWSEMTASLQLKGADWGEIDVNRRKAGNRLSAILIDFINKLALHETTDRMERYLSAVAKVILSSPDRGLMEVIMCLTNDEYREKVLKNFKISDPMVFATIEELHEMTPEARGQIVRDIMSRVNILLNNDYMKTSLLQAPKLGPDGKPLINVRRWIDGDIKTNPKYGGAFFVGILIPKSELLDQATDRLATFWDAKIWLAALSRYDLPEEQGCHGKPFVYVRDEPHQTPSAFNIHDDSCRESRKWGMKNVWVVHKMEDFAHMKKTLQDAGAQYTMYSTSQDTIKALTPELYPFTAEELLKLPEKRVNVTKFAHWDHAFISESIGCPKVKDRSHIRAKCSKQYGRPLHEVEKEIFERTSILRGKENKNNSTKRK